MDGMVIITLVLTFNWWINNFCVYIKYIIMKLVLVSNLSNYVHQS